MKADIEQLREMLRLERGDVPCIIHNRKVQKVRGLGDVVAAMTTAIGLKPCRGCRRRQRKLNKLFGMMKK